MNYKRSLQLFILLLMMLVFSKHIHAQKEEVTKGQLTYLNDEQKLLLKEQQELLDKTKSIIKDNLTEKQLAIVNNRTISKSQRTKLLRQSLSKEQHAIISNNRQLLKAKRTAFRNSLTKKQTIRLRRFLQKRSIDDRKRLARRLRRLIRDNIDR